MCLRRHDLILRYFVDKTFEMPSVNEKWIHLHGDLIASSKLSVWTTGKNHVLAKQ
jgi:hypothetical protein